jgi:threonine dehydratase
VRSFKVRGAYNKMARLSPEQLAAGVICTSAGNHAQGVAMAAKALGCKATIVMPTNSPEIKINAVKKLGGTVELSGESFYEAQLHAVERSIKEGKPFVSAYDDPYIIAGQGTAGYEILRQIDMDTVDAIFVPMGGGGIIAGIAAVVKALKPSIQVIGVEPVGANAMTQSLVRGSRVVLSRVDAFADGVALKLPGAEPFRLCRELVDGCVLVDNSAISSAIKDVFNETRSILEPSGAVAVAGVKAYVRFNGLEGAGKTFVALTSGANMNFDRLRVVSDLADVGVAETQLAVGIPERPGSFAELLEMVSGDARLDVTECAFRLTEQSRHDGKHLPVLVSGGGGRGGWGGGAC